MKISLGVVKALSEEAGLTWQRRSRAGREKTVLRARAARAMVDLGGMRKSEAAEVMGVSPQAVDGLLRDGRRLAKAVG